MINGGKFYQPHVVERITDENGNAVQEIQPTLLRETISESTSETTAAVYVFHRYLRYRSDSESGRLLNGRQDRNGTESGT